MTRDIGHFIGGRHVAGASGRTGDVFNPALGELSGRVAYANESEVDQAVQTAKEAFAAEHATSS